MTVVNLIGSTNNLIVSQGYRLTEDAWDEEGRRTYLHDGDLSRSHITSLTMVLKSAEWRPDPEKLWSFVHPVSKEIIEIEPGGPDTSGFFLHHMKQFI